MSTPAKYRGVPGWRDVERREVRARERAKETAAAGTKCSEPGCAEPGKVVRGGRRCADHFPKVVS